MIQCMNKWANEQTEAWRNEPMNEPTNKKQLNRINTNEPMHEQMNQLKMNQRKNKWIDDVMKEPMDKWLNQ